MDADQTGSFFSSKTRLSISEFKNIFNLHIFRCGVLRVEDKNHIGVTKSTVCSSISNRHPVLHYFHNFGFHSLALHQRRGYTSTKLHIEFPHHIYIICDINLTNPVFGITALYVFWVFLKCLKGPPFVFEDCSYIWVHPGTKSECNELTRAKVCEICYKQVKKHH